MKRIDLHVHSNQSDGTLSPKELVRHALSCGLSAFALTDHDNINGLTEAIKEAEHCNVELIPGIEFSTEYHGTDLHIVGLDFNWNDPDFLPSVQFYQEERLRRNQKIIDKMAADGIDISWPQMEESFGNAMWTRAHFGRYLVEHHYVESINDAFTRYLGEGCKYFIPRQKVSPFEVIAFLHRFGGIPVLAHPFQYRFTDEELRTLLKSLKECGLLGMEVYYSGYTHKQEEYLLALASEFHLAPSGGSDFHGTNKPNISLGSGTGNLQLSYDLLDGLRHARATSSHFSRRS